MPSAMRPSPHRHTLAVLRTLLGLTQKEMADLADCSRPTIQAIELGKLTLSDKLAGLIAVRTGVALSWLLDNDVTKAPRTDGGGTYTREFFQRTQSLNAKPEGPFYRIPVTTSLTSHAIRLAVLLVKAQKKGNLQLCVYKIARALDELDKEFSITEADEDEVKKAMNWGVIAGEIGRGLAKALPHEPVKDFDAFVKKYEAFKLVLRPNGLYAFEPRDAYEAEATNPASTPKPKPRKSRKR
jgi:transcriptional regulator with XRE-family HTH domain